MILFNCKKTFVTLVPIWYGIVSRILSWIFEGDGITSQMEGYFSVLLFSILLYVWLYFVFFIAFVTKVFERPSGENSP